MNLCNSCFWDVQALTVTPEGNFLRIEALIIPTLPSQRDSAPQWEHAQLCRRCSLSCLPCTQGLSSPASLPAAGGAPCWPSDPRDLGLGKAVTDPGSSWRAQTQKLPQILSFLPSLLPCTHPSPPVLPKSFRLWNFPLSKSGGKG